MEISFVLTEGQAKIVHIDADGNATTLIECTPETFEESYVTKKVSLTSGKNRLKRAITNLEGYKGIDIINPSALLESEE